MLANGREHATRRSKLQHLAPAGLTLRDADRYLWGRPAARQLERDIQAHFCSRASAPGNR